MLGHKILIIGVYAPHDDANLEINEEFFEVLISILSSTGSSKEVIVMGDFNGRISRKAKDEIVGQYGEDVVNDNGIRLIEVCDLHRLRVQNGFYEHKAIHTYLVLTYKEIAVHYRLCGDKMKITLNCGGCMG